MRKRSWTIKLPTSDDIYLLLIAFKHTKEDITGTKLIPRLKLKMALLM